MIHQEKRTRTRVPVHFAVTVLLGEAVIPTKIVNISLNGMLCTSHALFQNNALCKVLVSLSNDLHIVVDSKISRVDEAESAISFLSMDEESFVHLKKLVQYNAGDADLIDGELHQKAFDFE